jgi:hypothetical protein
MKSVTTWLAAVLTVFASYAQDAGFDADALLQIRTEVGPDCPVQPVERTRILMGNLGFWIERWTMETCEGRATYEVTYHPPEFFPDHQRAYEVRRIAP